MRSPPSVICSGLNQPNSRISSHKREVPDSLCSRSLWPLLDPLQKLLAQGKQNWTPGLQMGMVCSLAIYDSDFENLFCSWCTEQCFIQWRTDKKIGQVLGRKCMEYFGRDMRKPGENHKCNRNGGGVKAGLQRMDWRNDDVSCGSWWEWGGWLRQQCHCVLLGCSSRWRLLKPGINDSLPVSRVPVTEIFIKPELLITHLHKHLSSVTTV